jgi:antitoxin HicB
MRYHFKVHKEGTGFWAECVELQGCQTQGKNREELEKNMAEVLNLYLSEPEDSTLTFPLPKKMKLRKNLVNVPVDPSVALAFLLKRFRHQKHLTQREVANLMGLQGSLYKYQRLEQPKTANPELKTRVLLRKAFPNFDLDLLAS